MKLFKGISVVVLLLLSGLLSQAQIKNFSTPRIWLRVDSMGNGNVWKDMSGNGYHAHAHHGQFNPEMELFNYQPCLMFDSVSHPMWVDYTAKRISPMIAFAVYKPTNTAEEAGIWALRLDSAGQIKLTSQKLGFFGRDNLYNDSTSTEPVLNLLKMSWKGKDIDTNVSRLYLAGTDSLDFRGKFAEFMFYDSTLSQKEMLRIHTYLAIKYGINIREFNYVNFLDSVLWDYETDSLYSNNIAGIGKDSLLLIDQKQSCGRGGEANLSIAAGTHNETNRLNQATINEMDYLIWGDNGNMLNTFSPGDSLSQCAWLMKRSGATANDINTQLILHAPEITDTWTLNLIISREADFAFPLNMVEIIFADSVDTLGNYYFSGINWDFDNSGSDAFTFQLTDTATVIMRSQTAQTNNSSDNENNQPASISSIDVYPNPTSGEYSIDVKLTQTGRVLVSIQDEGGKIVSRTQYDGSSDYSIKKTMTTKGCYLIKAETGSETKTTKLIVQ
ncbi:MAG TPA: T9SS type A sorting domain-containing protein [Bacteroidales bacterium]|nr:T9SS type A sorting domain-containing protein [Bacteroidales bacterium]